MKTIWNKKIFNLKFKEILEYKQSLAEREVAGKDICAFANKKGGILFFGF